MAVGFVDVFWLVVVGALWGCTNPYLKRGAEGVNDAENKEKKGGIQNIQDSSLS